MSARRSVGLVIDGRGRIRSVLLPGDELIHVELPSSYGLLTGNEFEEALAEIPKRYSVYVDSAGYRLVRNAERHMSIQEPN